MGSEPEKDEYVTIKEETAGIYKSKGSKFLSYAYPVDTDNQAIQFVDQLKRKHHAARHHCYAYVIGVNKDTYRINDDGEPSGTAGRPIMGQIHSKNLTNVLVVVVRYFGGTLLGTGGLISAYKSAAKDALDQAGPVLKTVDQSARVNYDYEDMDQVMRILNDEGAHILEQDFQIRCSIVFSSRKSKLRMFIDKLNLLKTANCEKIEG